MDFSLSDNKNIFASRSLYLLRNARVWNSLRKHYLSLCMHIIQQPAKKGLEVPDIATESLLFQPLH